MKKLVLLITAILLLGQAYAQSLIKFKFYDKCSCSLVNLNYELTDQHGYNNTLQVKDSLILYEPGPYIISVSIERDGFIGSFYFYKTFESNKIYSDTLELSKITACNDGTLDSKYWKFHFCNRVCNGHEIEYYENGAKCIEGNFKDGLPKGKIYYYDPKGRLSKTESYSKRGLRFIKNLTYKKAR